VTLLVALFLLHYLWLLVKFVFGGFSEMGSVFSGRVGSDFAPLPQIKDGGDESDRDELFDA